MKTATFLFLLLFPSTFFAQRGYCPCMERKQKNDGIDLSQILHQANEPAIVLDRETPADLVTQTSRVMLVGTPPPRPEPEFVQQVQLPETAILDELPVEEDEKEEINQRTTVDTDETKDRSKLMKRKKRKRVRLRISKRKTKKYRGKCPAFN